MRKIYLLTLAAMACLPANAFMPFKMGGGDK